MIRKEEQDGCPVAPRACADRAELRHRSARARRRANRLRHDPADRPGLSCGPAARRLHRCGRGAARSNSIRGSGRRSRRSICWRAASAGRRSSSSSAGVFALLLAIGFYTRTATVASWLLLLSLQARNPLLLNFGDQILRVSMFWSLFLPLGGCWSVDAVRAARPTSREPVCSVASACLLLQVCVVYFFTAVLKSGPDWHADGTALYYAMQLDWLVLPLGIWLRDVFWFTQLLTWSTLVLEYVGPFLLIAPVWPLRCLGVLAFARTAPRHLGDDAARRVPVDRRDDAAGVPAPRVLGCRGELRAARARRARNSRRWRSGSTSFVAAARAVGRARPALRVRPAHNVASVEHCAALRRSRRSARCGSSDSSRSG